MERRIEICGGIAAGKTTLAGILEMQGYDAVYERFYDNPFLNQFYQSNGLDNEFETEMVFMLLHYNQIKQRKNERRIVSDYSMLQDFCYGVQNLRSSEKKIFEDVYRHLSDNLIPVDWIIYLKCGVECLQDRIRQRGRNMESTISDDYLRSNIEILEYYLKQKENVVIIDSEKYDFRGEHQEEVLELLKNAGIK